MRENYAELCVFMQLVVSDPVQPAVLKTLQCRHSRYLSFPGQPPGRPRAEVPVSESSRGGGGSESGAQESVLVAGGAGIYFGTMYVLGMRPGDLRHQKIVVPPRSDGTPS